MSIPPQFLDELRNRLTLSDVIGKRVKIIRAGREFKACCPFHNEKSPSFTINDDKQFYHCFGCGAHGDVINFVMEHDNLPFPEAVEFLATQAGMNVPQQSVADVKKAKEQKDLYTLLEDVAEWFMVRLHDSAHWDALDYMTGRGVSTAQLEAFRIGFAPSDGDALMGYLKGKGYTEAQALEAGVVRESTRGGAPYAFFRDRIMFPVADRRGRVVAFGGRILPDHLRPPDRGDFKPPKYINSSDTPLFHKGRMLFAEPLARQAAGDGQAVLVVEGYLDVMACHAAGFRGAVAPLGTALTDEQIMALWKMIPGREKVPYLCFDGDNAGRRAAARAAQNILPLLQPDHSARIAFLPEGQDPDTLIKGGGRKAMESVLAAALPLGEFLWRAQLAEGTYDTPESRAGLEKALDDMTARIADRTVQQYYRNAFREKLRAHFAPQRPAFNRGGGNNRFPPKGKGGFGGGYGPRGFTPPPPGLVMRKPVFADATLAHQILLAALLNHPDIYHDVEEDVVAINMSNKRLDLLRQAALNLLDSLGNPDESLDRDALTSHLREQGFAEELNLVLTEAVYVHAAFARPQADSEKALQGWRDTVAIMQKKSVWQEMRAAGAALAQDMSEENEQRLKALRDAGDDVHKGTES